jgi:hypothetical protein
MNKVIVSLMVSFVAIPLCYSAEPAKFGKCDDQVRKLLGATKVTNFSTAPIQEVKTEGTECDKLCSNYSWFNHWYKFETGSTADLKPKVVQTFTGPQEVSLYRQGGEVAGMMVQVDKLTKAYYAYTDGCNLKEFRILQRRMIKVNGEEQPADWEFTIQKEWCSDAKIVKRELMKPGGGDPIELGTESLEGVMKACDNIKTQNSGGGSGHSNIKGI